MKSNKRVVAAAWLIIILLCASYPIRNALADMAPEGNEPPPSIEQQVVDELTGADPTIADNQPVQDEALVTEQSGSSAHTAVSEYLVGFKKGAEPQTAVKKNKKIKHKLKKQMKKQNTVIMDLDAAELSALRSDPDILFVEKNDVVSIQTVTVSNDSEGSSSGQAAPSSEVIPWGHVAIGANLQEPSGHHGEGIKVAVLDTGISPHPDLSVSGGGFRYEYRELCRRKRTRYACRRYYCRSA